MDIILIGRAAEDGTLSAVQEDREFVAGRYSMRYLSRGLTQLKAEFADEECMRMLTNYGCDVFIVGRQGIYQALWALGETLSCGLRVRLEDISISQFCIEIAELKDVSPYSVSSLGCIIACCGNGCELTEKLSAAGYTAAVIGYTTEDNIRGIINHDTLTFLTPPHAE